ncbi:protein-glutamate methylesterase/protein-glutamine glutaminase [Sphingosinicella soli]|uniref:Protein-glutamate methylesterase/protein-glutamine glutaminase n=1 Tax=Sphingosinicella soli TaxID=333708 RepID=A0A7W7B2S4_9SPHN|nr:chemotaxis response regulator protein-glutamate methylesterase [Sphingosinicella soli]MBB4632896.1 two-component system chemotaxis response regulator CheB [Sphingosinicella soli]
MNRAAAPAKHAKAVRVLLVDDSGVSRALMTRWLHDDPQIRVVTTASNGADAIEAAKAHPVDVIVLDVEMPRMDGIAALPRLVEAAPGARILMASTITTRGARVTFQALNLGATDAIAKPRSGWATAAGPDFRDEFVRKVRALGEIERPRHAPRRVPPEAAASYTRAEPSRAVPQAIAIGASTGGPNALFELIEQLPKPVRVPIIVTQHMPPTFTAILAEHIARRSGLQAFEASHRMPVQPGVVYVAPGGRHMEVARTGAAVRLLLTDAEPENFCRPSVNPMLRSAAAVWGAATLGVMLTGMGSDGLEGARAIVAAGGTMLAQDQASSVVWGMPGAVVKAGLAAEMLPISGLASAIGCLLEAGR